MCHVIKQRQNENMHRQAQYKLDYKSKKIYFQDFQKLINIVKYADDMHKRKEDKQTLLGYKH